MTPFLRSWPAQYRHTLAQGSVQQIPRFTNASRLPRPERDYGLSRLCLSHVHENVCPVTEYQKAGLSLLCPFALVRDWEVVFRVTELLARCC